MGKHHVVRVDLTDATKEQQRLRRQANHKRHRERQRAEIITLLGGICACCQEAEPKFLCVDHIFGGGNEDRRTHNTPLYARIIYGLVPLSDYQILCHNCNWAKSHGGCPHGSPAGQLQQRKML